MKIFFVVLISLLPAVLFAQSSTDSLGALKPIGNYPNVYMQFVKGGFKKFNTIAERNAMPLSFSDTGMICYVTTLDSFYYLKGGTSVSNWTILKTGSTTGGTTDTTALHTQISNLNTAKLNASDSGTIYVTPSQLQTVGAGNVYHSGDNIVQVSGASISVDTASKLASKTFVSNTYLHKNNGSASQYVGADDATHNLDKTVIGLSNVPNIDATNPANISQTNPSLLFSSNTQQTYWSSKLNPTDTIDISSKANVAYNTLPGKDDIFSVVPYSNTLKFSTNKSSTLHVQTGQETFSIATDTMLVGKSIQLSIQSSGDSLYFDTSKFTFDQNIRPQFIIGKINDFLFTLMSNGKAQAHVSTRAANYANIVYSTKVGFTTQAGFYWSFMYIKNPTAWNINISAGTSSGASDIFNVHNLMPGVNFIHVERSFDNATPIFFTFPMGVTIQYGLNATTMNQTL